MVALLAKRGATTTLNDADRLAIAATSSRIDEAHRILAEQPHLARTGDPEEDRPLADVAGRNGNSAIVQLLITAGADLTTTGLDGGTALDQAAWFGQPGNACLLIDAGRYWKSLIRHTTARRWAGSRTDRATRVARPSGRQRMWLWPACCWRPA